MNSGMSWLFSALFCLAFYWCLLVTLYRTTVYLRTPLALPIALMPAPKTRFGVLLRMLGEVLLFRALLKANWQTWLPSIAFHYGLLLVLLMHLRFVFTPLPLWLLPFIVYSGYALALLLVGCCVLLLRRIVQQRVRYISAPSDYLHLLLFMAIAISGALMKRYWPTDLYAVVQFLKGAVSFQWQLLPHNTVLYVHLLLVCLLLLVFPISKLIHAPGIMLSPTLACRDPHSDSNKRSTGMHNKNSEAQIQKQTKLP